MSSYKPHEDWGPGMDDDDPAVTAWLNAHPEEDPNYDPVLHGDGGTLWAGVDASPRSEVEEVDR